MKRRARQTGVRHCYVWRIALRRPFVEDRETEQSHLGKVRVNPARRDAAKYRRFRRVDLARR